VPLGIKPEMYEWKSTFYFPILRKSDTAMAKPISTRYTICGYNGMNNLSTQVLLKILEFQNPIARLKSTKKGVTLLWKPMFCKTLEP